MGACVMPETSHIAEEMKGAGEKARRGFEEGFSGGSGAPDRLGDAFADKFASAFNEKLRGANLGFNSIIDQFSQVDSRLAGKLKGQLAGQFRDLRKAQEELTAAKQQDVAVSMKMQKAQENGFNKASIMVPLLQRQSELHETIATKTDEAKAAQDRYNKTLDQYNVASASSFSAGSMMAGMLGGAMVMGIHGVVGGFEKLIDLGEDIFKEAIHSAVELEQELVDIGERFEYLNIGIEEFSGATGQALTDLQSHALGVYEKLDVTGRGVGQTYAKLGSMLGATAGPALDDLTRSITDLQGRYQNLNAGDLGGVFVTFGTDVGQANDALASLLQTSRNLGVGLGDLTNNMSGDAAVALKEAGLNIEQSGEFVGQLLQKHLPVRSVIMGLSSAMKEFSKEGLDFSTGMTMISDKMTALIKAGDTTDADALAAKFFGGRRATEALTAIQDYQNALHALPGAFDAPAQSVDDFIDKTQTLRNQIDQFKHQIEGDVKPFADNVFGSTEAGLKRLEDWIQANQLEIVAKIKQFGDEFIDTLPEIKSFAADFISITGVVAEALRPLVLLVEKVAGGILIATGHLHDGMDLIKDTTFLRMGSFAKPFDEAADKINSMKIDTDSIKDMFDKAADSAASAADSANTAASAFGNSGAALGIPPTGTPGGPAFIPGGPTLGPAADLPSGLGDSGWRAGVPNGGGDFPWTAATSGASGDKGTLARTIYDAVVGAGYSPQTGLYAVASAMYESSLNPDITNASGHHGLWQESADKPSAGAGQQISWFLNTLDKLGGPAVVNANPRDIIANRVEVGGYPGANYDQFIQQATGLVGPNLASTASYSTSAGPVRLMGYSTPMGVPTAGGVSGVYANPNSMASRISAAPTVEAGIRAAGGLPTIYPTSGPGAYQVPDWAKRLAADFGLTASTYDHGGSLHQMGYAMDFNGPAPQLDAFSRFIEANLAPQTLQLIHRSTLTGQDFGIAAGQPVGPGTNQPGYYAANWAGHGDHVHWATDVAPVMNGAIPAGFYGNYNMGGTSAMNYAMSSRLNSDQEAIQRAKDRKSDLDWNAKKAQQRVDDLNQQLTQAQNDPTVLRADPTKLAEIQERLTDAMHDRDVAMRNATEQDQKIADAEGKLREDMSKPEKTKGGKDGSGSAAHDFGQSFLSGIGDELGLSNVFGSKAPWGWGSAKLGLGLLNWGAGELKQMMGGAGQSGTMAGGDAADLFGGLMNMNLAKMFGAGQPGAPSVPRSIMPGLGTATGQSIGPGNFQPPGIGGGNAFGPAPGPLQGGAPDLINPQFAQGKQDNSPSPGANPAPAVYHVDNSIHVASHGHASDVAAWQAVQNSAQRNMQMASAPGTFPAR